MKYLKIHPDDSVAVALEDLPSGTECRADGDGMVLLKEDIPRGHKFALKNIAAGGRVLKYGNPIGIAKTDIEKGAWVHVHNLKTGLGDSVEYTYTKAENRLSAREAGSFMGYRRSNGSVGIRNEIWIIPTVGCVNDVAKAVERLSARLAGDGLDAVCAFTHPYGCSQMGDDQEHTRTLLADLIKHPNAAAVLVIGLGCENSNIDELKKYIGDYDGERVRFLVAQECEDEIGEACSIVEELAAYAKSQKREPVSMSELIVGLKCGGSDGLSGITANPSVGVFSDMLVSMGGTTILTEVPEMFGAERLLMDRCENEALFDKTVCLINDFKDYFTKHGQVIYENPSPGNKKGGISTLEDKSLGCTQKSGSAPVRGVLAYGERVAQKGLNLLSAPGNDLVAATALAASGAQIVLFTTGRGTPFSSPVPTVKISTNTQLAGRKANWIDFDCGHIVDGRTIEETGRELFDYVIEVAEGRPVKAEEKGFHDFAIFKQGVTL